MSGSEFDLIVVGAGSGGLAASKRAASYGAKVAVVESDRVGGTCVIRGCIPKKLMVYASHLGEYRKMAEGYGWSEAPAEHSWERLVTMRNDVVARLEQNHEKYLSDNGVRLIRGRAYFEDPQTVRVGETTYRARYILIATGATPSLPDTPGIGHALSSDGLFELQHKPRSAVIVGGGYIAVEFAGILHGLGVETTLVVRECLLRAFDREIAEHLCEELRRQGLDVRKGAQVREIRKTPGGIHLELTGHDAVQAEHCVVFATGRVPRTKGMGLEEIGIKLGGNAEVLVDGDHATSVPNVFAVGDVTDRANLTPVAVKAGRTLADRIFGGCKDASMSYDLIPTAVFSDPPIGAVGLSEEAAKEKYGAERIKIYRTKFVPLAYSAEPEERKKKTFMKLVVHAETDRVLGAHMVGDDAPEIIQGFAVALKAGATKAQFDATVAIHPSSAEEFVLMR